MPRVPSKKNIDGKMSHQSSVCQLMTSFYIYIYISFFLAIVLVSLVYYHKYNIQPQLCLLVLHKVLCADSFSVLFSVVLPVARFGGLLFLFLLVQQIPEPVRVFVVVQSDRVFAVLQIIDAF